MSATPTQANKDDRLSIKSMSLKTACASFMIAFGMLTSAHATISCAGYLPNSYFERIENNVKFAGKLTEQADGSQQLQDLNGNVILDSLTDAYIVMDTYLLAKQQGKHGVANAAGEIIVPFEYDEIHIEPDIATSFIVSLHTSDDASNTTKQGIINRHGNWIYPLADARIQHAHYDPDYDQDFFTITDDKGLTGLLDDRGYWAVMPQYDAINPLNTCTGDPLYMQVSSQDKTALIDQNNDVIIPLATNQHIELFNSYGEVPLFLRSTLVAGSTAEGMSEDIQDDIESAQIIDANGKLILSSDAPIKKLLYHQLYIYKQAGKIGLINDKGNVVLEPQFNSCRDDADEVWLEKQGKMLRLKHLINPE
ncbi:WG repeat-containing protein [Psychrobacter halodurans]|uniref:WG repeat-containing protein n=1 Tax=Psychrobacter halodurans TaxID=2818439 RepID=A0AAW4IUT7_9GAMM|nr:WG repeat-containing protein [Psychrobacter halodurans]MBO1516914.1 WG repeat-containing protein [Psychrobacter halodurans]